MRQRVLIAVMAMALLIVGVFVWQRALSNEFLYDDDTFIVLNEHIRTLAPVTKFFLPEASSNNPQMNRDIWRPLTTLTYAVQYQVSGLSSRAFHGVNLLGHLLNALLVFCLTLVLLRKKHFLFAARGEAANKQYSYDFRSIAASFTVALIFLVHPVQVETVAWVSQRSNELFLFFYLLSLIFFIESNARLRMTAVSAVFFILSLLSKEMALSLPLVLAAYELTLNRSSFKDMLRRTLPYWSLAVVFVFVRTLVLGQAAQTGYWAGGLIPQMLTMIKGFFYYVKLMVIPYPLSVEYLFGAKTAFDAELLLYTVILSGILCCAWRVRKEKPLVSFGIFLFFLSLAPVSNIIPIRTIINERFLYLAVIGFGFLLAEFVQSKKLLASGLALVAALCMCYGSVTMKRICDWKDHWSFVNANLKTCPQSATLHFGMGRAYAAKGEFDKAAEEFDLCLRIDPQYDKAANDLDRLSARKGDADRAIAFYRQTVQKRVNVFEGLHNLGVAYLKKGMGMKKASDEQRDCFVSARDILKKASFMKPDDLEVKANLATAYAYSGNIDEAINVCVDILHTNPDMIRTRSNLGLFYRNIGLYKEAKKQYVEILKQDPKYASAQTALKETEELIIACSRNNSDNSSGKKYNIALTPSHLRGEGGDEGGGISKLSTSHSEKEERFALREPDVTKYIQEKFCDPMIRDKFIRGSNRKLVLSGNYYKEEEGYLGSSQKKGELRKEEIEALEALARRGHAAGEKVRYSLGRNYSYGYRIEYGSVKLSVEPQKNENDPQLAMEQSAAVYKGIDRNTDVVFVGRAGSIEKLYLLRDKNGDNGQKEFTYNVRLEEDADSLRVGSSGNLEVKNTGGTTVLSLSKPLLIDSQNKKAEGWYEVSVLSFPKSVSGNPVSDNKREYALKLCYNDTNLSYPIIIDPTWVAAGSMTTSRTDHTSTLLPNGKVLIAGGDADVGLSTAELYDPATGTFSTTGSMSTPRNQHTATLLPNGKVLLAGGATDPGGYDLLSTAELYNPATGIFSTTGSMSTERYYFTATLLQNGKVLMAGANTSTAELYDPDAGSFSTTGSMSTERHWHTATLLPDGKVLIAGGDDYTDYFSTAELYDPVEETFSTTGSMSTTRCIHTATLLPDGNVLIAGGNSDGGYSSTAELYDPVAGTFATTGSMSTNRGWFSATLLPDGKVLVAGGFAGSDLSTAELYDPDAGTFTTTGSMSTIKDTHSATLLPDGKVLITGGDSPGGKLSTAELYDPGAGTFAATGSMSTTRFFHTATLLPNGKVLIAGGTPNSVTFLSTAELYDPGAGTFETTGSMTTVRGNHTATLLSNGKVLMTGGNIGGDYTSTAELYNPDAGTFASTGSMSIIKEYHTATLLPNGKVLITGGHTLYDPWYLSTAELYDPDAGTFASTGSMSEARYSHAATLLLNGKVLITGSATGQSTAELYDPGAGTFETTGSMSTARGTHAAVLLQNGKVLVAGGQGVSTAQLYNPETGTFLDAVSMSASRESPSGTLLPNGKVMIAGGYGLSTVELYDPAAGTFSTTASMLSARGYYTATLLPNGKVLMAGNYGGLSTAELVRYTEYDYTAYSTVMQPSITTLGGSSSFPLPVAKNTAYTLGGSKFKGYSEGSNGSFGASPTNYPRVYLRSINDGHGLVNISTSAYPLTWSSADTSIDFKTPACLPAGYYLLSVVAGAVPSDAKIVFCPAPITGPLSGSYDIGGGAYNFATLAAAVTSLNTYGLSGDVTFNVYAAGGPYTGILLSGSAITGAGTYAITFRAASGQPVINLGGTNGHGVEVTNTFKQLNFDNIDIASATGHGYYFNSATLTAGATIQNCTISGYDSDSNGNLSGIHVNGSGCDNILISSNTVVWDDDQGIYFRYGHHGLIRNNTILGGDGNEYRAIYVGAAGPSGSNYTEVYGNTINPPTTSGTTYGLALSGSPGASNGLKIYKNTINCGTTLDQGINISAYGSSADADHIVVYNNLIKTPQSYGIRLEDGSAYIDFFFNTISGDDSCGACFYTVTGSSHCVVENNIFYNSDTGTSGYVIGDAGNSGGTDIQYNYNLFYSGATNKFYYNGTDYSDLSSWQAAGGNGWDANSRFADPEFVTTGSDFHIQDNSWAQGSGTAIVSPIAITTDFDGDTRGTPPDIGYDENLNAAPTPLDGSYDIGGGANDFATLTAAVTSMNTNGLTGNVTFNVYAAGGPYTGILLSGSVITGAETYSITFRAASGQPVINLGGTNGHGVEVTSTFKQVNFDNIDVSNCTGNGYYLNSATLTAGATIQNCTISGYDSDSDGNNGGILVNGNGCDNVLISSNTVVWDDYEGIYLRYGDHGIIQNNTILGGDGNEYRAIYVSNSDPIGSNYSEVYGNTINPPTTSGTTYGIYLTGSSGSSNGLKVYRNTINCGTTLRYGLYSSSYGSSADADHIVFYNNLIKNPQVDGIRLEDGSAYIDFYFNTVYGDTDDLTGASETCFYTVTGSSHCVVKNNIFYNGSTGTDGKLIYDLGNSGGTDLDYTYNLFYSGATNKFYFNGTDYGTLANWQTAGGNGWDAGSCYADPKFVSLGSNFHVQDTSPAQGNGTAVTSPISITTDFEGNTRGTPPDIGYDENLNSTYKTRIGSPTDWTWKTPITGDIVPSGTPTDWTWRTWQSGSGRKVPQGDASSWTWGDE